MNFNNDPIYRGGNSTDVPLNQAQHWMVWQRPGGRRTVNKLYGEIQSDIPAGTDLKINITNRYNTYPFSGEKYVILTTNSWVAGRNMVLPILYLVVSGLCYAVALFFLLAYNVGLKGKPIPGDETRLSWMRNSNSAFCERR